jgi:hypothetical protein
MATPATVASWVGASSAPELQRTMSRCRLFATAVGVGCALSSPAWIQLLFFPEHFEPGTALFFTPVMILLTLVWIMRSTNRDGFMRRLLISALAMKLAGAAAVVYVFFRVYGGNADMLGYFNAGQRMIFALRHQGDWPFTQYTSTEFADMITGGVLLLIGTSFPAAVAAFAILSYFGQYFYYRAFVIAMPHGNRYLAATLLMLLPSIVYWTAPMGKDSLILLFMSMAIYGYARMYGRIDAQAWAMFFFGMAGSALVRPHIAAMLAMSFTVPYLFSRNRQGLLGMLARMLAVPLLLFGTYYLVSQAQQFVHAEDVQSAVSRLETIQKGLQMGGGSSFGGSLSTRLALAPFLPFRPFPWEVRSVQMAIASVEGMILMALLLVRRRKILGALRGWRENPVILMAAVYCVEFLVLFSAASGNFGTLSRQRVMMLPLLILLCCAWEPDLAIRETPVAPAVAGMPGRMGAAR